MEGKFLFILMTVFILSLAGCNDANNQKALSASSGFSEAELPSLMTECDGDDAVMKQVYPFVKVSEGNEIARESNMSLGVVFAGLSGSNVNFALLVNDYIKNKRALCIKSTNSISLPILL